MATANKTVHFNEKTYSTLRQLIVAAVSVLHRQGAVVNRLRNDGATIEVFNFTCEIKS